MNFLNVRVSSDGASVEIPSGVHLPIENGNLPEYAGKEVALGIRPEHFELAEEQQGDMSLNVDHVEVLGADTLVHGHFGEDKSSLTIRLSDIQHFEKNTILPLNVPPSKLHLFDSQSGTRLGK
jgi:sn-glycerol 3-phosphate transport system ATP-binding protein